MLESHPSLEEIAQQILEGKQLGQVYHFTSFDSLQKTCMGEDPFVMFSLNGFFSLTRNRLLNLPVYSPNFRDLDVRYDFDGDKLTDRYHTEPVSGRPDDEPFIPMQKDRPFIKRSVGEAEEIIRIPEAGLDVLFALKRVNILTRPTSHGEQNERRVADRLKQLGVEFVFDKRMR